MKCRLYNITGVTEYLGIGSAIRYERTLKRMYYEAYRIARKAYSQGKDLDLMILTDNECSLTIRVIPAIGMLITQYGKTLWVKEVR